MSSYLDQAKVIAECELVARELIAASRRGESSISMTNLAEGTKDELRKAGYFVRTHSQLHSNLSLISRE